MSTTLLTLDQMLLEAIGDWLQELVTTELLSSTSVVSTHLTKYRSTADFFNKYYCYVEDYNNKGDHYISADDGTNTLTSLDTFVVETPLGTEKATFRLSRFSWADRIRAIDTARKQIYPDLFIPLDNKDLITGNILPPFNWATTATLDIYAEPSGTLLKTTDGDYIRRGSSSAKVTASGANDVISIDSTDYPRLLDLMGKTIDFKCWAYPVDAANDAFLTIQWTTSAGVSATVNSTTTCPAGQFTLLEIEDQAIPDDIVQIQFRMRVLTTLQNVYFDQPRVIGRDVREYLLPKDAQDGTISKVYIQSSGYSDDACDDLHPQYWQEVFDYYLVDDGTYKYLHLPLYSSETQIRLIGYHPLEDLLAGASTVWAANTITPDGKELELLTAYAAHLLYEIQNGVFTREIDAATSAIATIDTEIATEDTAITAIADDIASVISSIDTIMATVENVASEDISRYDAKIGRLDSKKKRIEDKRDALQDKRARLIVEKTALDDNIRRLDGKKARMEHESYEWLAKYRMLLPQLRMVTPRMSMSLRGLNG